MTREEAIKALSHCMVEHRCQDGIRGHCEGCNQRIAIDMAIEALENECMNVQCADIRGEEQ